MGIQVKLQCDRCGETATINDPELRLDYNETLFSFRLKSVDYGGRCPISKARVDGKEIDNKRWMYVAMINMDWRGVMCPKCCQEHDSIIIEEYEKRKERMVTFTEKNEEKKHLFFHEYKKEI